MAEPPRGARDRPAAPALALETLSSLQAELRHGDHRVALALWRNQHGRYPVTVTGPGYMEAWTADSPSFALEDARAVVGRRLEDATRHG